MGTNYRLYIYKRSETNKVLISSKEEGNKNYSIRRLAYKKGLYAPNSVEIEISVSGTPSNADINAAFASKSADLSVCAKIGDKEVTQEICKDYIVYQFRIVSVNSTRTVHLTLFSRDKLLTLDKFSRVYLNQRLGLNIIEDSLATGGFLGNCKVEILKDGSKHLDITRLQFLYYKKTVTDEKGTQIIDKPFEAIQPYRVQYNEDFHQFISRVACQCGEMLFFEDGKLILGPDTGNATFIDYIDISRIEYPSVENSKLKVNDYHRDFFKGDDAVLEEKNGLQYSDCAAFDEYYDILNEDKLPDSMDKEFYWPDIADLALKTAVPAVGIAFASSDATTASQKIAKAVKEGAVIAGRYATNSNYVNKKYTENVFEKAKEKTNNYDATQQKNKKELCQFADAFSDGQLKHGRLAELRELEMTAAKQTITVQIKTSSFAKLKLKLGSRVTIPGEFSEDVIDKRKGDIIMEEQKYTAHPGPTHIVTACRSVFSIKDGSDAKDITEIEIVPLQGSKFVPPYNKCAEFTPAQPQTAIVSDAADPRLLGRVRVRYPWQVGKLGSPWVRVLTPFSTANGDCIHFQPKAGDEVMIGYVGGNIERPYVIGSLFGNDRFNIHDSLFSPYNSTIKVGSQRLDFREGSLSAYASLFSGWKFASQFIPGVALNMKTKHSSDWHGITRLTDANSFWKIEGNTAARAVTIDSAWGKVTISAYTGINIEAVGDVTIKGNNINIKAQNNVTIESGLALKNARKSHETSWGDVAKKVVTDIASDFVNFDLSFLRTLWESIVPPKEGTLKIKSNRYLLLEAGKDGTALDNDISLKTKHRDFAPDNSSLVEETVKYLNNIYNAVDMHSTEIENAFNDVRTAVAALDKVVVTLNNNEKFTDDRLKDGAGIRDELAQKFEYKKLGDWSKIDAARPMDFFSQEAQVLQQNIELWEIRAQHLESCVNSFAYVSGKARSDYELNQFIIGKLSEEIKNQDKTNEYSFPPNVKTKVYQDTCEQYFATVNKKFTLGNDNPSTWEDKVKGLKPTDKTVIKPDSPGFGEKLFSKTIDSFATGSDYGRPAYTDSQAQNLPKGKIIMSYNEKHSLVVTDGNEGPNATGTLSQTTNSVSLESVKAVLRKTFVAAVQNNLVDLN